MKGYVYILKNEAMPGLLKIGRSKRSVEDRAKELYTSGVPHPFEVVHSVFSPDCEELEEMLHVHFIGDRVRKDREFFRIQESQAKSAITEILRNQIYEWVLEFDENACVLDQEMNEVHGNLDLIAFQSDVHWSTIYKAAIHMTIKDLQPVIDRLCFEQTNVVAIEQAKAGIGEG